MKTQIYILLGLFLFMGCNKEKIEEPLISELSVLMNGEPWDNVPQGPDKVIFLGQIGANWNIIGGDSTVNISLVRVSINPIIEYLYFSRVPFKTGKYKLIINRPGVRIENTVKTSIQATIGGDVSLRSYNLLPSDDGYITIKSIDRVRNIIGGEFQGTYIDGIDTLRFTEGVFRTAIVPYLSDN